MLLTALAALLAPAPPQAATPVAGGITYAVYVWSDRGRCTYQTGDVLFDASHFREDLKERFDPTNDIMIYVGERTSPACVDKAKAIAHELRFRHVSAAPAPADLDMGPPHGPAPNQGVSPH